MERIPVPVDRPDQIQPFTEEQVQALLRAASKSKYPKRNEAILLLMLDTGLRVSEICALNIAEIDLTGQQVSIQEGKGGNAQFVPFARETKRGIYNYLRERGVCEGEESLPFLPSDRGSGAGERMSRGGLLRLYIRLGKVAGINGVRCSPHTMRHTFAIFFLRTNGNVFSLKLMLGHESLAMVNRYVALSQADVTRQHAQHSPVARLKRGTK